MAVKQDCCSVPQGRFFIGDWGGLKQASLPSGGVITPQTSLIQNAYLGLTDGADIKYGLEEPSVTNTDTRGAGMACYVAYLKEASLDISVLCNRAETAALATLGIVTETATGTVTGEFHTVIKNATSAVAVGARNVYVPFNYLPDPTVAPVVKDKAGTTTYTAGTDYIVVEGGIEIPPTSTISNSTGPTYDTNFQVAYTRLDTQRVDAFTKIATPQSIWFDGFDRTTGQPRSGWIYKAVGMAKSYPWKSKDIVKVDFSLKLLPDSRIAYTTGSNATSQYFHFLNA